MSSLSFSLCLLLTFLFFFFNDTAPTEIYTLSLHDALPISSAGLLTAKTVLHLEQRTFTPAGPAAVTFSSAIRSEEHTSELQSLRHLVCRLLLEKKKKKTQNTIQSKI